MALKVAVNMVWGPILMSLGNEKGDFMDIRLFSKRLDCWRSSSIAFMCAVSFFAAGCRFAFDGTGAWEFAIGPDNVHLGFDKRLSRDDGGTQSAIGHSDFGMGRLGVGNSADGICSVCGWNVNRCSLPF